MVPSFLISENLFHHYKVTRSPPGRHLPTRPHGPSQASYTMRPQVGESASPPPRAPDPDNSSGASLTGKMAPVAHSDQKVVEGNVLGR